MKPDPDKDPGGPVPLAHKSVPDVPGVGLGHLSSPLGGPHLNDPSTFMRNPLVLPGSNMNLPLHLGSNLSPAAFSHAFLGPNFNSPALMTLSGRGDQASRGGHPLCPPLFPATGPHSYTNLHAFFTTADGLKNQEFLSLFGDQLKNQEMLFALSKYQGRHSGSVPSSSNSGSSFDSLSPSTSSSHLSPHQNSSPPPRHLQEVSPPEKHISRASSISPSSHTTPRSLNSSPSTPNSGATHNYGARIIPPNLMSLDSLSPTSPSGAEGLANSNSPSLPTPRKTSTPRSERVFVCKVCFRSFGYKHVLQNHERTHTGEKPFECKECNKRFTRDHHLKTHMRLHTGEKPYKCHYCSKQFVQVANLRRHLRVHTGEKPYVCEICSSKFSDSNQLKSHRQIHKGEKNFSCDKCQGTFRRKQHLISHKCPVYSDVVDKDYQTPTVRGSSLSDAADSRYSYDDNGYGNDEGETDEEDGTLASTAIALEEVRTHYEKRRERKNREPRRLLPNNHHPSQVPSPISMDSIILPHLGIPPLPEQTEPEDLSVNGSRRNNQATYRANIALTRTSKYPPYSLTYSSSSPEDVSIKEEDEKSVRDRYDSKERFSLPSNL